MAALSQSLNKTLTMEREQLLGIARAEREALGRTIQYTPPDRWDADSPYEGWRNRDVVAHLAGSEAAAAAILGGEPPAEFEEYMKSDDGKNPTLEGWGEFCVRRRADLPFRQVVTEWGRAADLLLTRAAAVPSDEFAARRVPWVAGDIPLRYLLQSRIAEWWAHGHDIYVGAGLEPRLEHWPIYCLNDLAIRALPWALGLAGLRYQGKSVRFDLGGVGGGTWHYGLAPREVPLTEKRPDAWVTGRGYPFALVAARRAPADEYVENGTLQVSGDGDLAVTVLRNIRAFA